MLVKQYALPVLLLLLCFTAGCAAKQPAQPPQPRCDTRPDAPDCAILALIKPADGPINSHYGIRRHPTQKKKKFHTGIDIGAKRGSNVVAAAPGTVVFSGRQRGYGKTVRIEHPNGITTLYAHMDNVFVREGQTVEAATPIGLVGRTGRTTGPNLHFEVLAANGKHTNPVPAEGWRDISTAAAGKGATHAIYVAEAREKPGLPAQPARQQKKAPVTAQAGPQKRGIHTALQKPAPKPVTLKKADKTPPPVLIVENEESKTPL